MDEGFNPNCRCSNCRPISLADAENHLLSGIYYFAIAEEDAACENNQSCDCNEVIVCTKQGLLLIRSEYEPPIYDDDGGRFSFYSIDGYQAAYYNLRISSQSSEAILTNEKYKGDALLQKCFTTDFLTKKQKVNEGEVPQYYVEGSHEAIIDPIDFDYVQAEIARRKRVGRSYSGDSVFASRIICGDCGGHYGPKVWHSNDSYRKVIWRCNRKFNKGQQKCQTPTVNEETIKKLFLEAYNIMMGNREQLLGDCKSMYEALADFSDLDARIKELTEEIRFVSDMSAALIKQHATQAESEEEYNKRRAELVTRYEKAQAELEQRNVDRQLRHDQRKKVKRFIDTLKDQPLVLPEWNEQLWARIVESVTLYSNGKTDVRFVNGICISVDLP